MTSPLRPVESAEDETLGTLALKRKRPWLAPLLVIGVAALIATVLLLTRPEQTVIEPEILPPLIRTERVNKAPLRLDVRAEGSAWPQTESSLVAEVAGQVIEVSPSLEAGAFFREGDTLLRLDPRDYRVALDKAQALVARRRSEFALARRQLERRQALADRGIASPAALDDDKNRAEVARASLRDAEADLDQAKLGVERSEVRAPYDGRVLKREVDRGQYVATGTAIATIYATRSTEVRLPISDQKLSELGLALDFQQSEEQPGPSVELRAGIVGQDATWSGRIDRVEGEIDARTRMVHLVAVVDDPFSLERAREGPPLAPGLFVEATIMGREVEAAIRIPSAALRPGNTVLVVDDEERLRIRPVVVLRREREHVVIASGLETGELLCVSPLEAVTDGMRVRTTR